MSEHKLLVYKQLYPVPYLYQFYNPATKLIRNQGGNISQRCGIENHKQRPFNMPRFLFHGCKYRNTGEINQCEYQK